MINTTVKCESAEFIQKCTIRGLLALFVFVSVLAVQAFMWNYAIDAEESGAINISRSLNPNFRWAFDEWSRCNEHARPYAKDGYFAKDKCDAAVMELGRTRYTIKEAEEAIAVLRANMIVASHRIGSPQWPLRMFF